ncbi:MAG: hypothetical protein ACPGUH_06055 [Winogradskyella sp.]
MKKYVLFFLMSNCLLFFSCDVKFEPNVRVLATGLVVDELGDPISGAEISVYTRRSTGIIFAPAPSGTNAFLLGRNYSNENGEFNVVSLLDKDIDFSIVVLKDNNYTYYEYATSTVSNVPDNLVFNLETITLKRVGTFNYNITRVSGEGNSLQFSFKFKDTNCFEYFDEEILVPLESYCFENQALNRTLGDENPNLDGSFKTPYGTEVEFSYSTNEQETITEIVTINQDNYDFTFNY